MRTDAVQIEQGVTAQLEIHYKTIHCLTRQEYSDSRYFRCNLHGKYGKTEPEAKADCVEQAIRWAESIREENFEILSAWDDDGNCY